jgi:hypothetical protein
MYHRAPSAIRHCCRRATSSELLSQPNPPVDAARRVERSGGDLTVGDPAASEQPPVNRRALSLSC